MWNRPYSLSFVIVELVVVAVKVRGKLIGRVPIEPVCVAVIASCRARVSVAGEVLHVAQRHARVEGCRNRCVAQAVGRNPLRDACSL